MSGFRELLELRLQKEHMKRMRSLAKGLPNDEYWKQVGYVAALEDTMASVQQVAKQMNGAPEEEQEKVVYDS